MTALLSAKEAARYLGISRPTLSRLIRAKSIGVYRVGTRTLFDHAILDEYKSRIYQPPRETEPHYRSARQKSTAQLRSVRR